MADDGEMRDDIKMPGTETTQSKEVLDKIKDLQKLEKSISKFF